MYQRTRELLLILFISTMVLISPVPAGSQQTIWPHPDSSKTGGWLPMVWHQEFPFNARCPYDTVHQARSLAGCVAVAMAQLIHYHHNKIQIKNFDARDNYTSVLDDFLFRVDQDCGSYNTLKWPQLNQALSQIQFPLTDDSDSGLVDELVYSAAVAVQTSFGADYSQAAEGKIPAALRSCFGFSAAEQIIGSDSTLLANLQWCIKNALPVIVVLTRANETPHAVLVDGLDEKSPGAQDDLYHINYGGVAPGETFWASFWPPLQFNNPINHGFNKIRSIIVSSAAAMPPPPPPPPPTPPKAKFVAKPIKGWPWLYVNFINQCTGTVSQWEWDFGDGSAHENYPSPTHCYQKAGPYTVTLMVTGPVGCDTLTAVDMITVYDTPIIDTGIKISVDVNGTAAWGDMDNDGDLDLLVQNYGNVYLYRNDQNQIMAITIIPSNLTSSAVQWIDLDRDNDLDLAVFGKTSASEYKTQFYRNDNGRFSLTNLYLPPVYSGAPAWGDYDNDGDPDMAAVTERMSSGISLWQNTIAGFIRTNAVPNNYFNKGRWCDVDHDQDLDLITESNIMYRNENGRFSAEQLPWSASYSLNVADYDHDGDMDFLVCGNNTTSVYQNTDDICNAIARDLTDTRRANAVWLDYDGDGRNDILLNGTDSEYTQYFTKLYHGQESGYSQVLHTPLDETPSRGLAVADYDQDDDPDFLTIGDNGSGGHVGKLFINNSAAKSVIPAAPQNLHVEVIGHTARFSWVAPSSAGLTYNLSVGTSPGSCNILSPLSLRTNGERLVPCPGNVWNNTQWHLRLPTGEYYWTVQSVDVNYNGSLFAAEQHFSIPQSNEPLVAPDSIYAEKSADSITLTWRHSKPEEVYRYHLYKIENSHEKIISVLDGNMHRYSDYEIAKGQTYAYFLIAENWSFVQSQPSATVTVVYNLPFTCMNTMIPPMKSIFEIADIDIDGDMDIIVQSARNSDQPAIFYNNLGNYSEKTLQTNGLIYNNLIPMGDFDNDNDPDVILINTFFYGSSLMVLRNTLGYFSETMYTFPEAANLHLGNVYLADTDNNGRQDILVNGIEDAYSGLVCSGKTIKNTINGWQIVTSGALSAYLSNYHFCDYDLDGDQDILLQGLTGPFSFDEINRKFVIRLLNNHRGQFSVVDSSLLGWTSGEIRANPYWRDWDRDGDGDIAIVQDGVMTVYFNDQGCFTRSLVANEAPISGIYCDLNNDGWQDVIRYVGDQYYVYLQTDAGWQPYYSFSAELGASPCVFDYDVDGDQDLLLATSSGSTMLFCCATIRRTANRCPRRPSI